MRVFAAIENKFNEYKFVLNAVVSIETAVHLFLHIFNTHHIMHIFALSSTNTGCYLSAKQIDLHAVTNSIV